MISMGGAFFIIFSFLVSFAYFSPLFVVNLCLSYSNVVVSEWLGSERVFRYCSTCVRPGIMGKIASWPRSIQLAEQSVWDLLQKSVIHLSIQECLDR